MKKSTTAALFLSPAFFFGFFCLIWIYWLSPFLKNLAIEQIPQINSAQPYIEISVKNIEFSILKLQARVDGLTLQFKKQGPEKFKDLAPIEIHSVKAQVDLFSLVVGQFSFSNLNIEQLKTTQNLATLLNLKGQTTSLSSEINLHPFFEILDRVPIQKIILQNSDIYLNMMSEEHLTLRQIHSQIKNLILSQKRNSILIQAQDLETVLTNQMKASATIALQFKGVLTETSSSVDQLEIKYGASEIQMTSTTNNLKNLLLKPETNSNFNAQLKLDEIKNLIYIFKDQSQRLPQVFGAVRIQGQVSTLGSQKNSGSFQISTKEVRFENLKLGDAKATAQVKNNRFLIDSIKIEHPSGLAELKQISIQQEKPFNFKTDLKVQNFHLQKLFASLNLTNIPADLKSEATAQCTGQIENFKIHCSSQILAQKISVQTDLNDSFYIAQINKALIQGDVDLNLNSTKFKADLQIGQNEKSNAQVSGEVDYKHGFQMKFNSKYFDLSEIQNIANLGLKGIVSGELSTSGNADYGVIDSKLLINNFIIDHFSLGQIQTHLKYNSSKLSFLETKAKLNNSNYSGDVELDFLKSNIQGQLDFKPLFMNDVLSAIEDRWHLPIVADGVGSAHIHFLGPLNFWQLKYTLQSEFQHGQIMNENFVKLNIDLTSDGEKIDFKNVALHKPNGSLHILNNIQIESQKIPQFNLQIKSNNLRAEEIDHLSGLFSTANGVILLNGSITSDILNPQVQIQTQTKDLKIDNLNLPRSQGEAFLSLDNFKFQGQIFGRQLQLDLNIPLKDKEKFYLKAQARDLNPLLLLPMINLPLPPTDTFATVSGDINLKADTTALKNLSGTILLENILLQRSTQQLKLKKNTSIVFDHGLKKLDPIELIGADQNLKIALKNGSSTELEIAGRFFLRPLQFLVPFFDNMSGSAEINCLVNLNSSNLNLSGEGVIDNASISMKGFKYPINDITAYFDFSKSKILFSEINASLNQTSISGQGSVDIKGSKNIDVQLSASTDKLDLEFPNKYQTSGNADIQFFGHWLPYNLKINYLIDEGNITKEFTEEDANSILSLRPSPFLPAQQLNQKNQSLLLDVTADFSKGVTVKNRILEGIATGKVHVSGSPENPVLQGRIDIQPGSRLIFKDKPFDIQLGYVTLNGEYVINPQVFINANARVSDYDINLLIQGPGKSLDIKPTSQPNLSREDIISLLALGYTASKNDQVVSSDVQQKQTGLEVLAALSNQSQLNKKLQEKLGLNVQLSPSIDSTRNIAVPKVIVSKKLSSKITTSYSRPLTGDQQENEVRMQYLWTKNWSLILNYQNQNTDQQTNILKTNKTETGVGGIDFEFKKEFGE